jgi:4-hydroxy-2-oxoheptanedioate aldolase
MIKKFPLHEKIAARELAAGLIINFNAPTLTDLAALIGFDFVLFDCEHGPIGPETAEGMIRAAYQGGIAPLVRVSSLQANEALKFLDLGAIGIMFPQVSSAADAKRAVEAVRFPPLGRRGAAPSTRAAEYVAKRPFQEYVEIANETLLVLPIIETPAGVEAIDEIAATKGIDVIVIGAVDLATAMGYAGNRTAPEVIKAVDRIIAGAKVAGKPLLMAGATTEQLRHFRELGADLVMMALGTWLVPLGQLFLKSVRA